MNVLIIPSADRQLQASLIEKYNRIGFNVYFPKLNSIDLTWHRIARWPSMVTKSSKMKVLKNLEIHRENWGNEKDNTFFGEDYFVTSEINFYRSFSYESDFSCEIVDLKEVDSNFFDFYHTTRGNIFELEKIISYLRSKFPRAKWISSTSNQTINVQFDLGVKNLAMTMPACYQDRYDKNLYNQAFLFGSKFERESLGLSRDIDLSKKKGVASFNHNYFLRYPEESKVFLAAVEECNKEIRDSNIRNYGGNISKTGADLRYDLNGPNGRLKTLGIRDALNLQGNLSLISLLKDDDHGGGCIWNSLTCLTPVIVHKDYYHKTKMSNWFKDRENCIVVDKHDVKEISKWFKLSYTNPEAFHDMSMNLKKMFESIEDQFYQDFPKFIENCR